MSKPIASISESMVEKWFRRRLSKAPAAAALEGRYLRAVINTSISEWGTPEKNPCEVLSRKDLWSDIASRQGIVNEQQMPAFWAALEKLPNNATSARARYYDARDYLQFLLFSGCRVEETSLLKPEDIDIDGRAFILRDPKNRQKNTRLPLNDQLLAIVQRRLELPHEFLFADETGASPMKTPRKAITAVRELSGVNFKPHDLRRTFRTVAAKVSLPMKTGAMLVNHKITGTLAVDLNYIIVQDDELLHASNKVAGEILRQVKNG